MIRYLKNRILGDSLSKVEDAFSKVDKDIKHLQLWVNHLNEKSEDVKESHHEHKNITKKDISNINKWLHYLYSHSNELQKFVKECTNFLINLQKKHTEIIERLEKLEQGQLRTPERTSQGHLKDKSLKFKDISKPEKNEKIEVLDRGSFTGTQIEMLNILYHSDRPLSYGDIAKLVGKKKKSIRNIIYELRVKGVKINDKAVGIRKKGFYLDKEEKIKVSGR